MSTRTYFLFIYFSSSCRARNNIQTISINRICVIRIVIEGMMDIGTRQLRIALDARIFVTDNVHLHVEL